MSFERRFQKGDRKAAAGEGAAAEGSDSEMDGELGDFMDDVETMDDDAESSEDEEGRTTLGPDDGVEVGALCVNALHHECWPAVQSDTFGFIDTLMCRNFC